MFGLLKKIIQILPQTIAIRELMDKHGYNKTKPHFAVVYSNKKFKLL